MSARKGACWALTATPKTQYMGAAKQMAMPLGKSCSLDAKITAAIHVKIRLPRMTGLRRPKREVQRSDMVPTTGPVKNPEMGPAMLLRVARATPIPRCSMYGALLGVRKHHIAWMLSCGRARRTSFHWGHTAFVVRLAGAVVASAIG